MGGLAANRCQVASGRVGGDRSLVKVSVFGTEPACFFTQRVSALLVRCGTVDVGAVGTQTRQVFDYRTRRWHFGSRVGVMAG